MFSLEGVGEDVGQFIKICQRLLSAPQTELSHTEKDMILYYCRELLIHTQSLRDEQND